MGEHVFVAVDLGAASGRVMVGRVDSSLASTLGMVEAHRFDNEPVRGPAGVHWDVEGLCRGVLDGLRAAAAQTRGTALTSVGIDSWAVDYGLLDADGALLGDPYHYRDSRTDGVAARVHSVVSADHLYGVTGVQNLPFTTIFQLVAAADTGQLTAARTLLMIPDLIAYRLTGVIGAEVTNASTTQLFDVSTMDWATELIDAVRLPRSLFPPVRRPGEVIGTLSAHIAAQTGLTAQTPVVAVGSHDTASAVVAVPADNERFAYISSGTWSLVGVELDRPVLTQESRAANFTNEVGVGGTIRYLRNVTGLWLLQESQRTWRAAGHGADLAALLAAAAAEPPLRTVIDPDDPTFLAPGDMPARIEAHCRDRGEPVPSSPAAITRAIVDSLAVRYRVTVAAAQRLTGKDVDVVHIVGGGARNALLCQLTADACGLPVIAGPVEATALGNILVQAQAAGAVPDLAAARKLVAATQPLRRYAPAGDMPSWTDAAARLGSVA
ncbi:MAG: rhamnulokinase [Jiangellaceae bacterium]